MSRTSNPKIEDDKNKQGVNVAITYIPNTFNLGSMMMAENLIHYLTRNIPNATFYTDTSSKSDLNRLRMATGIEEIKSLVEIVPLINNDLKKHNRITKKIMRFRNIKQIAKHYQRNRIYNLITLGGDDISEYYGSKRSLAKKLFKINILARNHINIYLAGQTIRPFTSTPPERFRGRSLHQPKGRPRATSPETPC